MTLHPTADVIISQPLKNLRHVEGDEVKLQCKVKNPKKFPVTWYKDGEEIKVPSDEFDVKEENGLQTLVIKKCKLADEGEYTCKIGHRSTSAKLTVDEGRSCHLVNSEASGDAWPHLFPLSFQASKDWRW